MQSARALASIKSNIYGQETKKNLLSDKNTISYHYFTVSIKQLELCISWQDVTLQ